MPLTFMKIIMNKYRNDSVFMSVLSFGGRRQRGDRAGGIYW